MKVGIFIFAVVSPIETKKKKKKRIPWPAGSRKITPTDIIGPKKNSASSSKSVRVDDVALEFLGIAHRVFVGFVSKIRPRQRQLQI